MKEIEITTKKDHQPFITQIEDIQSSIDEINNILSTMGYPKIEMKTKIGNLEDVKEFISKKVEEPIKKPTLQFDLENNTAIE